MPAIPCKTENSDRVCWTYLNIQILRPSSNPYSVMQKRKEQNTFLKYQVLPIQISVVRAPLVWNLSCPNWENMKVSSEGDKLLYTWAWRTYEYGEYCKKSQVRICKLYLMHLILALNSVEKIRRPVSFQYQHFKNFSGSLLQSYVRFDKLVLGHDIFAHKKFCIYFNILKF